MRPKLYSLTLSHPAHAARLMLEHKGIDHEVVDLVPGFHPLQLRIAGFPGATTPALKIGSRRIQGSLTISRALDEVSEEPRLFPGDPARRQVVEEAERWGEQVLQPVPRRLFRWAASRHRDVRVTVPRPPWALASCPSIRSRSRSGCRATGFRPDRDWKPVSVRRTIPVLAKQSREVGEKTGPRGKSGHRRAGWSGTRPGETRGKVPQK